jgi:FtsH-binding integral membrane protein
MSCAGTGGLLYIMGFVFVIMIFVGVFVPSNVYFLIISAIAAVLFSAYLLYDLQVRLCGL